MSMNAAGNNEAPAEELARLRRQAEARAGRIGFALGLLIAPTCMASAGWLTGDINTVRRVGWTVFNVSLAVVAISYFPFAGMRRRLDPVSEILVAPYSGGMVPSEQNQEVRYQFSRFTLEDFRVHRWMHLWGRVLLTAIFSVMGYAIARAAVYISARV